MRDFIRPAVRAVPRSLARRLGTCQVLLSSDAEHDVASRWTMTASGVEISITTEGLEDHDVAMEMLLCLGQAAWEALMDAELREYWTLLREEIRRGTNGEIDEQALEEKRWLLKSRSHMGSVRRLPQYGRASFAGTAAEYVHCLWHEVTVRTGPDHLPPPALRRRLELLAQWFPPDRGQRLFPAERSCGASIGAQTKRASRSTRSTT